MKMVICTLVSLVILMNKILNYLLTQLKNNFEKNHQDMKVNDPDKYYRKLENRTFLGFLFIASVITLFGIYITILIMNYLL